MPRHIVILGAGISGLATAWFLKQYLGSAVHLTIIEKSQRVGGWIQSIQANGYLFEQGPRSCRTQGTGQETLALIEALDLKDEVLIPHPDARNRYIYHQQGLLCLPRHLWEIPFNSLTQGWLKALWRDWRMPKCQLEDESIHSFFSRRLGKSWAECLIDPVVSGIYAGDCNRLSLKSCFPIFNQWEQQKGSLLRGACHRQAAPLFQSSFIQSMRHFPLFSFKQGMETLPRVLANRLQDDLVLEQAAQRLAFDSTGIKVYLENGGCLKADHVISTLPTSALSDLLTTYPLLATKLRELHYTTVFVVNIGFEASVFPLKGFGYLVPSKMKSLILGCVWDSCVFPQQNLKRQQTRLTVMLGGSHHPEIEQMAEQDVIEHALQALHVQMGIRANPQIVQIKKAHQAIPQYEVGYSIWKKKLQEALHFLTPHLTLSGSALTGVSLNDCIAQARQLAQQMAHSKISHIQVEGVYTRYSSI
jgi:oxygen-dependent protoporphyrinogen oxidase